SSEKKARLIKNKGIHQSMIIKYPLAFYYENDSMESIIEKLEYAIEQHPSFLKVLTPEEIEEQESLNKQREW
ncbi:MAG: 1-acyl-sn-glycerol-3-phosphate acyltransferase, partial [Candidatus Arcticimaribacter sp.]